MGAGRRACRRAPRPVDDDLVKAECDVSRQSLSGALVKLRQCEETGGEKNEWTTAGYAVARGKVAIACIPFANSHLPWPRELTDTAPAGHNRSAAARQRHGLTVNREVDDVRSLDGLV